MSASIPCARASRWVARSGKPRRWSRQNPLALRLRHREHRQNSMSIQLSRWFAGALGLLTCFQGTLLAQEGGGQAEIGFQQYYLSIGSQRVSNISGLALTYSQFIPDV